MADTIMYQTVRVCDVCGNRFRIRTPAQLRCSATCREIGARKTAAQYNKKYQATTDYKTRYKARRAEWRRKNHDRESLKQRQYVQKNRKAIRDYMAQYQRRRQRHSQPIKSDYIAAGTLKEYLQAYYLANRDKLRKRNAAWRALNSDRVKRNNRRWLQENRERVNEHLAARRRREPVLRLVVYMRNRITKALRLVKAARVSTTHRYVGLTGPELMTYLLSHPSKKRHFTADNYGTAWHCDHIRPLASFDLSKQHEAAAAFHFTNLQPMEPLENLSKGSLLNGERHRYQASVTNRRLPKRLKQGRTIRRSTKK